jgi:hypothetical protein
VDCEAIEATLQGANRKLRHSTTKNKVERKHEYDQQDNNPKYREWQSLPECHWSLILCRRTVDITRDGRTTCKQTEKRRSRPRVHVMVLALAQYDCTHPMNQTPSPAISRIQPPIATKTPGVLSVMTGRPSPIDIPVSLPIVSENQIHISGSRTKSKARNADSPDPVNANTSNTKPVAATIESAFDRSVTSINRIANVLTEVVEVHLPERLKSRGCGQVISHQETRDPQLACISLGSSDSSVRGGENCGLCRVV